MILNCEIDMKTDSFVSNRVIVMFQIIIIFVICSSTLAAPAVSHPRENRRQFHTYLIKNRHDGDSYNGKQNDTIEYDRPLIYRDLFLNTFRNTKPATLHFPEVKTKDVSIRKNRMSNGAGVQRTFQWADGMARVLTFPIKDEDRGIINSFEAENPTADCLTGGLDAGVVNGALKIGIGVGLAPGCGKHKEQPPKLVPVPIFIPRPVPVPVGVPQPYPIDVPRAVPIRVPVLFPSMNMGPLPMMGVGQQFPSLVMKDRRDCIFQDCWQSLETIKAATKKRMDQKYRDVADTNESAENTIIPESEAIMYRNLKSNHQTN